MKKITLWLLMWSLALTAHAAQYNLPANGNIVGELQTVIAKRGDTLNRLAVRYGVGYNEMLRANRRWRGRRIPAGTQLILPTRYQLPSASHRGIVINLADMRLFYYPPNSNTVVTFPVAVGKRGWSTPRVRTFVAAKKRNPTWTPPASIRREAARRGKRLRRVYRAGPNNPLGTRALRLGISGYLIHGTNRPYSIGKRVSHGCIRMRRADVEQLFSMVPVKTQVTIVSENSRLSYPQPAAGRVGKAIASSRPAYTQRRHPTKRKFGYKRKEIHRRYANPRTAEPSRVPRNTRSYITDRGLDYQRLNRDIRNGSLKPIDLSGI